MDQVKILNGRDFSSELVFTASRSSGPGGQNVNKVSSRIELRFNVSASRLLREEEKAVIRIKLANRISKEDMLILASQSERSQYENRIKVTERFYRLLEKALKPDKKRTPTRPTAASKARRLEDKQFRSVKKSLRKPSIED